MLLFNSCANWAIASLILTMKDLIFTFWSHDEIIRSALNAMVIIRGNGIGNLNITILNELVCSS